MAEEAKKFTKYEKARIIGARSLQVSMGAPLLIKLTEADLEKIKYDPLVIAEMEFEKGLIPISIKKKMPKPISDMKKTTDKNLVNL